MNKMIQILITVLLIQIGLAVLLGTDILGGAGGKGGKEKKLLAADLSKADQIKIEEKSSGDGSGGNESLVLKSVDGKWTVPSVKGFPAGKTAVKKLIDKFGEMKEDWPVATTDDAASRFKVAKDDYEAKVTFSQGDKALATIYIGTAPSFRKRHIRADGGKEIFAAAIEPQELSLRPKDWIDRSAFTYDADEVEKVITDKFTLLRKNGKWEVEGAPSDKVTNQVKADTAFNTLLGIVFKDVEGEKDDPEYGLASPELKYSVVLKGGKPVEFQIGRRTVNDGFILKSSDKNFFVSISPFVVENIKKLAKADLLASKNDKPDDAAKSPLQH